MKTRLVIIGTIVLLVSGFVYLLYFQYTHCEVLGVEMRLPQSPCKAIDEYGIIVDTKTVIEGSGYIVQSEEYALTWFGALQLLVIISIIGILAYVIYRRTRK